jgi:hypothetical protein
MTNDHHPAGRVPLPGRGEPGQYRREDSGEWDSRDWGSGDWHRPRGARRDGIGHARRMSNWSAATLIVGTGAAMVALARGAVPAAVPASVPVAGTPAAPAAPAAKAAKAAKAGKAGTPHSRAAKVGAAAGHRPPTASRSVATTSGSHVTSTTAGTAAGQSAPPVSSPVATTSASGVTTITTTNPVTGKKTVTKVRRGGRGGDD